MKTYEGTPPPCVIHFWPQYLFDGHGLHELCMDQIPLKVLCGELLWNYFEILWLWGSWKMKMRRIAVRNAPTTTFVVLFLCQNPLDKICKIQNPGSENQNPKSTSKFQNIRNSNTQNQKIQNSKIAKSKNPKSRNPKSESKIMVCSCACIYVFWLHQNYAETTSYKHFFGGVSIHFFATWNVYLGGGGISKSGRNVWRRFPSKKSRQGEKCIHRWGGPPPEYTFLRGWGWTYLHDLHLKGKIQKYILIPSYFHIFS